MAPVQPALAATPEERPVAIRAERLEKRFGELTAVAGIDLEVYRGECFGLLGPNGAGKTTTCEMLLGLTTPSAGTVTLLGLTWREHRRELRERVSAQLQEAFFSDDLTVAETVRLFRSFYRRGVSAAEAVGLVDLGDKARTLIKHLSGGQRQRVSLACALVCDPEIAFFDEPSTGLDPTSRRALWDVLERFRARGRTIVLTTHYMEEAERLCDRVAIVHHGRLLACDTPAALVASLGDAHVIELQTAAPVAAELFDGLTGVRVDRAGGDGARVRVPVLHEALPALLARLAERHVAVTGMVTRQPSLEDVFLRLTGSRFEAEAST